MTVLLPVALPAGALQQATPAAPTPGANLTVSLVTVGAGRAVWERFGHNLLWVEDHRATLDSAWDWGRFSFDTERFLVRFAQADMRYWMAGAPGTPVVSWYGSGGRTVARQELELTPAQRLQLLDFLRTSDTDANRYYQYHYYLDNCSTRIRDALDRVLGGAIRARTDTVLTPWTYRDHTQRLNQHNALLYFGLTTLLADPTDRRITAWEEMFLPSGLQRWVREVRVPDGRGGELPLVRSEAIMAAGGAFPVPPVPGRWWPGFLVAGVLLGVTMAVTGRSPAGRLRSAFLPVAALYLLLAGLLGLAMALLWGLSGHEVAWRNENLWQFNLAALALLAVIHRAGRGHQRAARAARLLALLIVACSILGVLLKVIPAMDQDNWDVMALAIPANLGMALGVVGGVARSEKREVRSEK